MTTDWQEEWGPEWAPHVRGRYTRRTVDEDGLPEEQTIEAWCTACSKTYKRTCTTGATRGHITRFAAIHVECKRDPLEKPFVREGHLA